VQASRASVLVRNVIVLMGSQASTWALSLAAAVIIPRFLGAELVGRLHLASALWLLAAVLIGFGSSLAMTKAVARDRARAASLLASSIALRVLFFVPTSLLLAGYAKLAGYSSQVQWLLVILGVGSLMLAISDAVTAVLQGLDRMAAMSAALVIGRLIFVAGAVGLLVSGYSVYTVAAASTAGSALTLALQLAALCRAKRERGGLGPLSVSTRSMAELLSESAPFFWISFSIVVYQQVDTIALSLLVETDEVLGWYSIYERLFGTLLFVPTVFMTAVFPTLSRLYGESTVDDAPAAHHRLTRTTFELMLLISVPIGLGSAVIAHPMIDLLFGPEFAGAAPVVAVGGIVILLTYQTTVLGMFLIAMDKQRQWTRFIALGAALTIPLDVALVPLFQAHYGNGAIGGAAAYLITETVILAGAIHLLPAGALGSSSRSFTVRALAAGLVMVGAVVPLRERNLLVAVAAGAVAYVIAAGALRLVSADDRRLLIAQLPRPLSDRWEWGRR
jgi:O-antigen/teichoic acid export membrane protein